MEFLVWPILPETPSLPLAPTPTGHSTAVPEPTLRLPVGADLGKIVGEVEGGARTVGAVHDGDRGRRQRQLRIELLDRRVIPFGDLAEEDVGKGFAVQHHVAGLDAVDIHHRNDRAHDHRPLREAVLLELVDLQRRVGGAEGHGLGLDLLDAGARADRLVVHAVAGFLLVGVGPFRQDREDKGRAGAGDVGGERRRRCGDQAGSDDSFHEIHCWSPSGERSAERARLRSRRSV